MTKVDFPTEMVDQAVLLDPIIGFEGNEALHSLYEEGFVVVMGLTKHIQGQIAEIGADPAIAEFCPKDSAENGSGRFTTLEHATHWQSKGRFLVSLVDAETYRPGEELVLGYAWSGKDKNAWISGADIKTAYRLAEAARGRGLAADFTKALVYATKVFHDDETPVSLETWMSNSKAVNTYKRAGFVPVVEQGTETRPTLQYKTAHNPDTAPRHVTDRRLHMVFP